MLFTSFLFKFLLTPLREGRLLRIGTVGREDVISTHAPAGGATFPCPQSPRRGRHFYSRPCGRGDRIFRKRPQRKAVFLLTPLREGRPRAARAWSLPRCISTHAPAGGATNSCTMQSYIDDKFLLTPLREGRLNNLNTSLSHKIIISTHAPAGGATPSVPQQYDRSLQFLLTPLREGRL